LPGFGKERKGKDNQLLKFFNLTHVGMAHVALYPLLLRSLVHNLGLVPLTPTYPSGGDHNV
jgi:hypothetical protein